MNKMTVAALGSALILAACGGGGNEPVTSKPDPEPETISVGVVDVVPPLSSMSPSFTYRGVSTSVSFPAELGEWLHIRGDIHAVPGEAAFGVAENKNQGVLEPWAMGDGPEVPLASNPVLSGHARWHGMFMGYGIGVVVGSDADLSIDLETLEGFFELSRMGYWARFEDIAPGTGNLWGDGNLSYTVNVSGSTFTSVGGDDGVVEGIFVGPAHEGMAGTLKRNDLVGAFGGSR